MTRHRLNDKKEIPLKLLPAVIARQIRKMGDKIYRISVKRTHWHHYNVSIRTKPIPKELAPKVVENPGPDQGVAPGKRTGKTGRCAA